MLKILGALIRWSLDNRPVVILATAALVLFGLRSAVDLPIDAVPDVTTVQVQVITTAPALGPVEIEKYVTVPVERSMAGIPKVTEIRSLSKYGMSVVTVVFEDDTNIYFARQMVAERMVTAREAIPGRFGEPQLGPISTGLGEIYQFVVRGSEGRTLMELQETLEWYVAPLLRMVPGVVEVNAFGGEAKEYQVLLDPHRLMGAGLSVRDVVDALEKTNANAGGGYIEHAREQIIVGTRGRIANLDELRQVVLGATKDGVPITVGTVGEVRLGPALRRGASTMDGKGEVVVGLVLMLMGENARTVTAAVDKKLAEIEPTLPNGIHIEPFYDRAHLVDRAIRTVGKNLAEGAVLVIVVLFLLLGDLRAGLIVAVTIPLSMLFALILMNAYGHSGNLMSLGAIDFGLVVDAAVIIVENSVRRLSEAQRLLGPGVKMSPAERRHLVHAASVEVIAASVFGQVIIATVYLPVLWLRGIEGKMFIPMATTVLFALAGAFILSLTLVPVLASMFLRPSVGEHEPWLMRAAGRVYAPILKRTMRWPKAAVAVALVALVAGGVGFSKMGAEFIPTLDEGSLLLEVRRLPGISLTESIATELRIERAVMQVPEVLHAVARTGAPQLAIDPMGIEASDVYLMLKPRDEWRPGLSADDLRRELKARVEAAVPEAFAGLSQPIQMRTNELVAGVHSDVAVQIYGPDLATLQSLGERIVAVVGAVPGAVDVRAPPTAGLSYMMVRPDRARLARYGLTVDDVNLLTETIAVGRAAGWILEGDRRFPLVVKMVAPGMPLEMARALPLESSTGTLVPLGDVADVTLEPGPVVVNRESLSRRQTVEFNVRGRDLVSVVEEARARVVAKVPLPPGYRVEWGGEFENFQSARKRLMVVVPFALGLIVFFLWMAFRALVPALLIFLHVPFAAIGGVAALAVRGIPFSISAGVGFIALFGVAVLNGLVLVSFTRHLEEDGTSPRDAVTRAASLRLRPVLMTALVAALGFVPMAVSTSAGAEVQRPLATVVIGGLVTATMVTLLLFPTVYAAVRRKPRPAERASRGDS
jgi:cobalt-zinc-cadmium resistance protein CzcA